MGNDKEIKFEIISNPKITCILTIPKGGDFSVYYTKTPNLWTRVFMRFIGWGVVLIKKDY